MSRAGSITSLPIRGNTEGAVTGDDGNEYRISYSANACTLLAGGSVSNFSLGRAAKKGDRVNFNRSFTKDSKASQRPYATIKSLVSNIPTGNNSGGQQAANRSPKAQSSGSNPIPVPDYQSYALGYVRPPGSSGVFQQNRNSASGYQPSSSLQAPPSYASQSVVVGVVFGGQTNGYYWQLKDQPAYQGLITVADREQMRQAGIPAQVGWWVNVLFTRDNDGNHTIAFHSQWQPPSI